MSLPGLLAKAGRKLSHLFLRGKRPATPAIFHVTHWKAGSQWIAKILSHCVGERAEYPGKERKPFHERVFSPGGVYNTCYVTHQEFLRAAIPDAARCFVVIRDLRDTLVSLFFSLKVSHVATGKVLERRNRLQEATFEEGMLYLLRERLPNSAAIQQSWLDAGEKLIKYEELLEHDEEILVPLLTEQCPLGIAKEKVRQAVQACRFENLTKGRARGEEDVHAHERKGIAGDWRNHFTDVISREFKSRFGGLLIATGYEKDGNW